MDSHTLLKKALEDYLCINDLSIGPSEIIITKDSEYGKPYLKGIKNIHFSISHSGKWWTCAIADRPVGLDLQEVPDKKNNVERLAKRFYHKREIEWLKEKSQEEFYRLWAYKESYVKYTGIGLIQGLDYFSVVPEEGEVLSMESVFQKELIFFDKYYYFVLTFGQPCGITIKALTE